MKKCLHALANVFEESLKNENAIIFAKGHTYYYNAINNKNVFDFSNYNQNTDPKLIKKDIQKDFDISVYLVNSAFSSKIYKTHISSQSIGSNVLDKILSNPLKDEILIAIFMLRNLSFCKRTILFELLNKNEEDFIKSAEYLLNAHDDVITGVLLSTLMSNNRIDLFEKIPNSYKFFYFKNKLDRGLLYQLDEITKDNDKKVQVLKSCFSKLTTIDKNLIHNELSIRHYYVSEEEINRLDLKQDISSDTKYNLFEKKDFFKNEKTNTIIKINITNSFSIDHADFVSYLEEEIPGLSLKKLSMSKFLDGKKGYTYKEKIFIIEDAGKKIVINLIENTLNKTWNVNVTLTKDVDFISEEEKEALIEKENDDLQFLSLHMMKHFFILEKNEGKSFTINKYNLQHMSVTYVKELKEACMEGYLFFKEQRLKHRFQKQEDSNQNIKQTNSRKKI